MTTPDPRSYAYPNLSEAQRRHEAAQARDPKHDLSSCVCCCVTCDPDEVEPVQEGP